VFDGVYVAVFDGVRVAVFDDVTVAEFIAVYVAVYDAVTVAVCDAVFVAVFVAVLVNVAEAVAVLVFVGIAEAVKVLVLVEVAVAVAVLVLVDVAEAVGVAVATGSSYSYAPISHGAVRSTPRWSIPFTGLAAHIAASPWWYTALTADEIGMVYDRVPPPFNPNTPNPGSPSYVDEHAPDWSAELAMVNVPHE
jgi:hypothetical protein